ncbi:hypothetical protein PFICI_03995 [Pestalotiopsis fici W106-1]|uniref:Zn(2)-C6 fungal-type domain-containing protein n=1 Tax=Pestalotiopsis fici (strain W106-1 / CGMCC3.15140) TaxID=1229662 RepID=W3XIX2_PESFW|nr:uncharacterized protein PFICI_03995 [Pestalotiopsis fici W106-1]ETS85970.1 hypothetical protein PFICI_03995 [Pestalotiopsis fici W106-1]
MLVPATYLYSLLQQTPEPQVTSRTSPAPNLQATDVSNRRTREPDNGELPNKRRPGARPRASQACQSCAAAKIRCDNLTTCRRCKARGVVCLRPVRAVHLHNETTSPSTITAPIAPVRQQSPSESLSQCHVTNQSDPTKTTPCSSERSNVDTFVNNDNDDNNNSSNPSVLLFATSPSTWPVISEKTYNPPQTDASEARDAVYQEEGHANGFFDLFPIAAQQWANWRQPMDWDLDQPFLNALMPIDVQDGENQRPVDLDARMETPISSNGTESEAKISKYAVDTYNDTLGTWHPKPKNYFAAEKTFLSIPLEMQEDILGFPESLESSVINHRLMPARRDDIIVVVNGRFSGGQPLSSIQSFPSSAVLDKFLTVFLTMQKSQLCSFIHLPTFDPNVCDLSLLMTCIAAGATASPTLAAQMFGFALLEILRWYIPTLADNDNTLTRSIPFVQSLVILSNVTFWSGDKRKSEISDIMAEFAVTMIRHARRLAGSSYLSIVPIPNSTPSQLELTWRHWVSQESGKRTVYQHLMNCIQRAVLRNTVVIMSCTEVCTPIPEADQLWFAQSALEWASTHGGLQASRDRHPLSLTDCFTSATAWQSVPTLQDRNLAKSMILYSSISMLVEDHRRSFVFNLQADRNWAYERISDSSTAWHIASLLDEMRGSMSKDSLGGSSANAMFLLEYYGLYSSSPNYLAEALLGDERFGSSRKALSCLRDWRKTRLARTAVWHAGQLFRLGRSITSKQDMDFEVFAMYQAVLCLWMYGYVSHESSSSLPGSITPKEPSGSKLLEEPRIRLDGAESLESQRWVSHNRGTPYIAKSSSMIGVLDSATEIIPITAANNAKMSFIIPLVGMMETHFSLEQVGRRLPILSHICRILRALGRVPQLENWAE